MDQQASAQMTSRDKVRRLFRGERLDGIVIDFGGMPSDGISAIAYSRLVRRLGLPERKIRVYDVFQQLALPDLDVIERMGGDFILAHRMRMRFGISCRNWKDGFMTDGTPCLVPSELDPAVDEKGSRTILVDGRPFARMPAGGFYYDIIAHPLEDCASVEDLASFRPDRFGDDEVDYIADEVDRLFAETDKSIVFAFGGSIFEQGQRDFGFENFYCNLLLDPDLMHAYFTKLTDAYLDSLSRVLPRIAGKADVIHFFDDLGTQAGLQVAPDTYRALIKPCHQRMFQYIHERFPGIRVLFHCCGAIFDLIGDLAETGIDLLNPVQVSAAGMDPQRLRDTYGDRLVFWGGGADMQNFVENSEPDAIRRHVAGLVGIFSQGGRYIFSQIHNIQWDVPVEKVLAIYETANQFK